MQDLQWTRHHWSHIRVIEKRCCCFYVVCVSPSNCANIAILVSAYQGKPFHDIYSEVICREEPLCFSELSLSEPNRVSHFE